MFAEPDAQAASQDHSVTGVGAMCTTRTESSIKGAGAPPFQLQLI
jgi:hypothetical protein